MIIFVDDEKWAVSGYIEYFQNQANRNSKYKTEHFFTPSQAWPTIQDKKDYIDLIIIDMMMFYGERKSKKGLNQKHGGALFLEEIRNKSLFDKIPILVYTVMPREAINDIINYNNVYYINRNCADNDFFNKVDELIGNQ